MQIVRSVMVVVVAVWGAFRLSGDVQAQLLGGLRAGSHTMTVGERERNYSLFVPPRAREPLPLVVVLHGGGGDGRQIERHSGFNALARTEGFAVCYPDAFEGNWNDGRGVEFMTSHQQQIDDVAFIRKLIDEVAGKQQIDRSRLFVVGISNGGFMTHRLVNDASDLFCAAGIIVGGIPKPIAKDFRPKHPVSVIMMQGEADPLVPYDGGFVAGNSLRPRGEIISTADTVALYLKAYKITGSPTVTDVAGISLDHDLEMLPGKEGRLFDPGDGVDVARWLASHVPTCPVLVHTTNQIGGDRMVATLEEAQWSVERVVPYGNLEWIQERWGVVFCSMVLRSVDRFSCDVDDRVN